MQPPVLVLVVLLAAAVLVMLLVVMLAAAAVAVEEDLRWVLKSPTSSLHETSSFISPPESSFVEDL
jgi:hypothetical protein